MHPVSQCDLRGSRLGHFGINYTLSLDLLALKLFVESYARKFTLCRFRKIVFSQNVSMVLLKSIQYNMINDRARFSSSVVSVGCLLFTAV